MKDRGETLADLAIRASFRGDLVPSSMGPLLASARKFVLDASMSSYMADLGMAAFTIGSIERAQRTADGVVSDHSIIHLHIPQKVDVKRMAAKAVAAMKRRAHQVRGHWRKDFRSPGVALCEHDFVASGDVVTCRYCGRRRLWIEEHQRGDASLGFVLHDYSVERGEARK